MKTNLRRIERTWPCACEAFTLIEMIGVLAVIAVLTSLLVPRIMESVTNGRVNHSLLSLHAIKAGVVAHYASSGSLASSNGSPLTVSGAATNYDIILLAEGHIDKPITARIGKEVLLRIVHVTGFNSSTEIDGINGAYDLDGDGDNDIIDAEYVIEAVFLDVTGDDARRLNERLDGPEMGVNPGQNDLKGQVIYHRPTPSRTRNVHVYVAHD